MLSQEMNNLISELHSIQTEIKKVQTVFNLLEQPVVYDPQIRGLRYLKQEDDRHLYALKTREYEIRKILWESTGYWKMFDKEQYIKDYSPELS